MPPPCRLAPVSSRAVDAPHDAQVDRPAAEVKPLLRGVYEAKDEVGGAVVTRVDLVTALQAAVAKDIPEAPYHDGDLARDFFLF